MLSIRRTPNERNVTSLFHSGDSALVLEREVLAGGILGNNNDDHRPSSFGCIVVQVRLPDSSLV